MNSMEGYYSCPLTMDRSWLCLFFLVLAIGLALATPIPGSKEAAIVRELRNREVDQAEVFCFSAKNLNDPLTGFKDSDFWSVQALTLMGVYLLARSARNKTFLHIGIYLSFPEYSLDANVRATKGWLSA